MKKIVYETINPCVVDDVTQLTEDKGFKEYNVYTVIYEYSFLGIKWYRIKQHRDEFYNIFEWKQREINNWIGRVSAREKITAEIEISRLKDKRNKKPIENKTTIELRK